MNFMIVISNKALDAILKLFKAKAPSMAVLLFSVDKDNGKILCLATVPQVSVHVTICNICTICSSCALCVGVSVKRCSG